MNEVIVNRIEEIRACNNVASVALVKECKEGDAALVLVRSTGDEYLLLLVDSSHVCRVD